MATTYKSKAQLACWKQHTCVTCASVYRYKFKREVEGSAGTAAAAATAAEAKLKIALETTYDMRPCPICGLIQPEMVGQERSEKSGCMTGLSILVAIILFFVYAYSTGTFYRAFSYSALVVGLFITLKHIAAALHNPNNDIAANKIRAAADVQSGTTVVIQAGTDPRLDSLPTDVSTGMKAAFLMLLAGLLLFPAAELLRIGAGWKYNAACDPPVCGVGETVRFNTGDTITSLKGYWNSTGFVTLKNAAELGVPQSAFVAVPRTDYGTEPITTTSKNHNMSSDIFVQITIPNAPQLAGKTAALAVTLDVTTPQFKAMNQYVETSRTLNASTQIGIAPAGAGRIYGVLWLAGIIVGMGLQIAAGFILIRKADALKKGLPTQLYAN